jgi:hypothetical protein
VEIEDAFVQPFLMGGDVHRYQPPRPQHVVVFPYLVQNDNANLMPQKLIETKFPKGWSYLLANKAVLAQRERGRFKETWWQYGRPQNLTEFEAIKIMTPDICNGPQMTIDETGILYHTTTVYSVAFRSSVLEKAYYFLGVLNSRLIWLFLQSTGSILRGGFMRFKTAYLEPFPIRTIDFDDPEDVARHDRMVALVERMLDLHKRLAAAKTPTDKTLLQRQIAATDNEIDRLVYDLYGLTDEEIAIVEGRS